LRATGSHYLGDLDGPEGVSRVEIDYSGVPALVVTRESARPVAELGLELVELTRDRAEPYGVVPYGAMMVETVYEDTAAAAAGLRRGDLVAAIDGEPMRYTTQMSKAAESWRDGQEVVVSVWPEGDAERATDHRLAIAVRMEPQRLMERYALESEDLQDRPYAGVVARGLPRAWCERLYGPGEGRIVLTRVVLGSPAWLAGLRTGDIVVRMDGAPIEDVAAFTREIRRRGVAGEEVALEVERGQGSEPYAGTVYLEDYSGEAVARLPVVFSARGGVARDSFTLGPWGSVVSWKSSYRESPSREPVSASSFSMLLGLFKFTDSPEWTGVRLLWFIKLGSS